ncbi:MAG: type II secretion system protein [Planctomycetota bacterium]
MPVSTDIRARTQSANIYGRGGFTLVEVLVSIAIMAILLTMMIPAVGLVRESTRRVVCASNLRQVGVSISVYADDYRGRLPFSFFADGPRESRRPLDTVVILSDQIGLDAAQAAAWRQDEPDYTWDGLGLLVQSGYLGSGGVLYCPSHEGEHTFDRYANAIGRGDDSVIVNYQYRGSAANPWLQRLTPDQALVSDGFRDLDEINHADGFNILRGSLNVTWFGGEAAAVVAQAQASVNFVDPSIPADRRPAGPPDPSSWGLFDDSPSNGAPSAFGHAVSLFK